MRSADKPSHMLQNKHELQELLFIYRQEVEEFITRINPDGSTAKVMLDEHGHEYEVTSRLNSCYSCAMPSARTELRLLDVSRSRNCKKPREFHPYAFSFPEA